MAAWSILLYGLLPLIAFVIVDALAGIRFAVYAAIAFGVADVLITRYLSGEFDPTTFVALALLIALGKFTLATENPKWVKLQPVAVALMIAGYLAFSQLSGDGLYGKYGPLIASQIPPDMAKRFDAAHLAQFFAQAVWTTVMVVLIHAALVTHAAFRLSNVKWLLIRGFGFWILVLVAMIFQTVRLFLTGA